MDDDCLGDPLAADASVHRHGAGPMSKFEPGDGHAFEAALGRANAKIAELQAHEAEVRRLQHQRDMQRASTCLNFIGGPSGDFSDDRCVD